MQLTMQNYKAPRLSLKGSFLYITFLIASILLFSGCRVSMVPSYSEALETKIIDCSKATSKLYYEMLGTEPAKRTYPEFSKNYAEILSEVETIELVIQGQKKNGDLLVQIRNVKKLFTQYSNEHRQKLTPLTDGEIRIYAADMQGVWTPLYISERGLKPSSSN